MINTLFVNQNESTLSRFSDQRLHRAVVISLFSWSRARDDDKVDSSRFGFWADAYSDQVGETGSLLYLLAREKITDQVMQRARMYASKALEWMTEEGVAHAVDVSVARTGLNEISIFVEITLNSKQLKFEFSNALGDTTYVF